MSRIRGGHNYFQILFSDSKITVHEEALDMILALNQETIDLHQNRLKAHGVVVSDQSLTSSKKVVLIDALTYSKPLSKKSLNIILLGVVTKLFNLAYTIVEDLVKPYGEINEKALAIGYKHSVNHFKTTERNIDHQIILNGNTALALGAITAGLSVFSAYPMTPATSIMNYLTAHQDMGYFVEQAEDEIAALHIALGASAAGSRAMTATSGGGLSLMVEGLGLTAITETPLVVVNVMRPGPATGLPTKTGQSDLSFVLSASQDEFPRLIISLRDVKDAFYQTIRAFDLADKYQIPVILLSDQYLADTAQTVEKFDFNHTLDQHLAQGNIEVPYARYAVTPSGVSPRVIPGYSNQGIIADNHEHDSYGKISEEPDNRIEMHDKRLRKLITMKKDIQEPLWIGPKDADLFLVGFGSSKGAIEEAVHQLNFKGEHTAGIVFGDIYPLPTETLDKIQSKKLINVEMNATGQLARLIRMETGITFDESILKYNGEQLTSNDITEVIYERF
jgi:2-oxoglutarate ferredoxin oxidoreductase subunit alpha